MPALRHGQAANAIKACLSTGVWSLRCSFQLAHSHLLPAEYLPSIHNTLCTVWGDCKYDAGSDLRVILQTDRGAHPHFLHKPHLEQSRQHEMTRCLAGPNLVLSTDNPGNTSANELVLVRRALVGFGPECRSDYLHCWPW